MPQMIGDDLLARDGQGRLACRIATVFPRQDAIVTLPGIHATQRVAFSDIINGLREQANQNPMTDEQEEKLWSFAVDLVLDDEFILIRPDPAQMALAFEADELLQKLYSKKQIKFLHVLNPQVREAIEERGECWRISPLPKSPQEMAKMIAGARIGIGGGEIYYYNPVTGTRLLTCQDFASLAALNEPRLRQHLQEIQEYAGRVNRMRNPEVSFFKADARPINGALAAHDFDALDGATLLSVYNSIRYLFHGLVPPEFHHDDSTNPQWRSAMYAALIGQTDKAVSEEALLGLSAEFFMQVEWVPGGRIEEGELIIDPIFEEEDVDTCCLLTRSVCDMRARGLIYNFIRDYGHLRHINIGRVAPSLSRRKAYEGHRGVYLAAIQARGSEQPILRIIRMQKRGVWELLDAGKDLLDAILESEDYTEHILNRRLACRQLGMNLPPHVTARKLCETYAGKNMAYRDRQIWSTYFERDYVPGLATDKITAGRFDDAIYALAFARALGKAAASNLIVGRCDAEGAVVFDEGDELIIEDARGLPTDIVVVDHTGTFMDCHHELTDLAAAYARPIEKRAAFLADTGAFAEVFLLALEERFTQIQRDYRKRRRAFDTLFKHQKRGEAGRFAQRWECALSRLGSADPRALIERIRARLATTPVV